VFTRNDLYITEVSTELWSVKEFVSTVKHGLLFNSGFAPTKIEE